MTAIHYSTHAAAAQTPAHTARAAARAALAHTGHVLGGWLRAMQTARMMSVLCSMSDAQLAQIGVARADIPAYAREMIAPQANGAQANGAHASGARRH